MLRLCLLLLSLLGTRATLFFQHQKAPPRASSLRESAGVLSVSTPLRLPRLHEELLVEVPTAAASRAGASEEGAGDSSRSRASEVQVLVLRVQRVFQHPSTRSVTACGEVLPNSPSSSSSSLSADSSGGVSSSLSYHLFSSSSSSSSSSASSPSGSFTLACQESQESPSAISCIANIRPFNSDSIQFELRHDETTKAHSVKAVNANEFYEPKVEAGDREADEKDDVRRAKTLLLSDSLPTAFQESALRGSDEASRRLGTDTNDILDMFVVWTPEAEAVAGSENAMSLYMDLVVDEANYVLENSQVELRLRIVHAMRMLDGSYVEPGTSLGDILDQATYSGASYPQFDTEQGMRYTEHADLFVVIAGGTAGNQCGIAWLKTSDSFPDSFMVSVSALDCLSGYGTMIHEIGHNLGCTHDLSASTQGAGYKSYSHGYCWDRSTATSCDGTCARTTMAYSSCVSPLGCNSCYKYDVFSNPDVYVDGSPVGTSSLNNARSLNESRQVAVAKQDSLVDGGLVFSVEPNHVPASMACFQVTIKGWHLGDGSDISSVSVAGVSSTDILHQSKHHVTLNVHTGGATALTGDIVVTSGGFTTTLTDGFTYDASSSEVIVEDFETKLDMFYQSDDSNGWYFIDSVCSTGTDGICESYGPATGDGIFALANVDGSGRDASFEAEFSSGNCEDTVSTISVKYYAYSVSSHCFSSDFIQLRVKYSEGGSWTTVSSSPSKQSSNNEAWNTLSANVNTIVYGVQVLTRTYSSSNNCDWWNPVAVDDITVGYTSFCDCATMSPTITKAPTAVPSTSAPTVVPEEDDEGIFSRDNMIIGAAALAVFFCIMGSFCWCDNCRTRRRQRREAQATARLREPNVEFTNINPQYNSY